VATTEIYRELNQKVKAKPRLWVTPCHSRRHTVGAGSPMNCPACVAGVGCLPAQAPVLCLWILHRREEVHLPWVPHWPSPTHTALCGQAEGTDPAKAGFPVLCGQRRTNPSGDLRARKVFTVPEVLSKECKLPNCHLFREALLAPTWRSTPIHLSILPFI